MSLVWQGALHPEPATGEWPWSTLIRAFLERRPWLQSRAHGFGAHMGSHIPRIFEKGQISKRLQKSYGNLDCQKLRALKLCTEKMLKWSKLRSVCTSLYLPGSSERVLQTWIRELKRSECPTKNQTLTAQCLWLQPSHRWRANLQFMNCFRGATSRSCSVYKIMLFYHLYRLVLYCR